MSHAMMKDRNGPTKVAEQQENIQKIFTILSDELFDFHKKIIEAEDASSIIINPQKKYQLRDAFYKVTNTHPSVAYEFIERLRKWSAEKLVPEYHKILEAALATGDDDQIFLAVSRNFTSFSLVVKFASTIFYTNQMAASPTSPKIDAPKQVLFTAFREKFYDNSYEKIRSKIQDIFFRRLFELRDKEDLAKLNELKPVAHSFSLILDEKAASIYQRDYVDKYIDLMVSDNTTYVNKMQQAKDVPDNIIAVAEWINRRAIFEQTLLQSLVSSENDLHKKIMDCYDDKVVAKFAEGLVRDEKHGFAASLRNESFAAVIELINIASRAERSYPSLVKKCVTDFKDFVHNRLKKRVIDETRQPVYKNPIAHADAFVKAVLREFHILEEAINTKNSNHILQRANNDSFKNILDSDEKDCAIIRKCERGSNLDSKKVPFPEVLAVFVDTFLKSDDSNAIDKASEMIQDIGALFSLVQDKDIFGEHYKLRLSKRLLLTKYNEDTELQVLTEIKKQSGKNFIHKFEGMINDVRVADTIQQEFEAAKVAGLPCQLEIKVLTFAYWPQIKPDDTFITPDLLKECQEGFTRYYRRMNPTKQLKWQAERGSAVLEVSFPKDNKEVSMNIYQAAVMIGIDAGAALPGGSSKQDLKLLSNNTGIEMSELKPLVASMMLAKGLALVRVCGSGINPKFTETDVIEMNPDFTSKMRKLKLPNAVTARTAASETVKDEDIDASRGQMLDATIVRIMKSRKQARQQELVELTIQSIMRFFKPQPRHIKLHIESLIEREFLERDMNEADVYHYLA